MQHMPNAFIQVTGFSGHSDLEASNYREKAIFYVHFGWTYYFSLTGILKTSPLPYSGWNHTFIAMKIW